MRICIDCRFIYASGIGRYTREIVRRLVCYRDFEYILIVSEKDIAWASQFSDIRYVVVNSGMYSIAEQLMIPLNVPECDIFWSLHYNVPILPIRARKRITTIHDVNHLVFQDKLLLAQKIYAQTQMFFATRLSDVILTVSEFSKNEIIKYTGIQQDKVRVVYNGIDFDLFTDDVSTDVLNQVKKKYSLPERFLLYVGNIKPHKNIIRLLDAYARYVEGCQDSLQLIIIGSKDNFIQGIPDLQAQIMNIVKDDRVRFFGHVVDEELPALYRLATVFIFPSFYEGFGFPPLEAMACGCPVISSSVSSLPEVCGTAAHYVDPFDIENIATGIKYLADNEELQEKLILQGKTHVKTYSWDTTVSEILQIFKKCGGCI